MSHLKKSNTTGHLLKSVTAGHLVNGCIYKLTPCVETVAETCGCCNPTSPIPRFWTLVFSDCSGTRCVGGAGESVEVTAGLNGTYVFEHDTGCIWQLCRAGPGHKVYSTEDCSGTPDETLPNAAFRLQCAAGGTWKVTVTATVDCVTPTYGDGTQLDSMYFWGETATAGWECDLPFTIQNVYTDDDDLIHPIYGGQVVCTPGDVDAVDCPGGAPIYTNTDLSDHVGKVLYIVDTCYLVTVASGTSDGPIGAHVEFDTCALCCADAH